MLTLFTYAFGVILVLAGAYHFINPAFYDAFMPNWFPKLTANYAAGLAEIGIGLGLFFPGTLRWSAWLALALMLIFLPLHVLDLLKERPVIGSHTIATVRLVVQFVLIYLLYLVAKGAP
ncbi:MauE/DoxX family redox-associated membrane protein [Lewinella sp. 4G2]|uniref:DoxX family protein n=1 Tax=Lewinella sp. 4G2 TaxID=1803372 RepID=UPI0007B4BB0D|nr:MauE/DoxX family redox-associated membrane protein [Lewinella sp. 4G2]OAV45225.1 hypothetical protein A3850_012295 [Lewinella sp. 4G2]